MKQVNDHLFHTWRWFTWHLMDFPEKNTQIKIRWENLWKLIFLILHVFICLILYDPCFYSSLNGKKQRNGGLSKISEILVKFAKNGCGNDFYLITSIFFVRFWQNLPISIFVVVNAAISLLFIAQWAVKTRMIEN